MKKFTNSFIKKTGLLACALIFLVGYKGFSQTQNVSATSTAMGTGSSSEISPDIKNMLNYYDKQIYFTQNQGQWDSKVLYKADFKLGQALATKDGMLVGTFDPAAVDAQSQWFTKQEAAHTSHTPFTEPEPHLKGNGWMMNFINHSPLMTVEGNTKHNDVVNYFNGNQPKTNIYSYQEIWYKNVYDNIDVRYYPSKDGSLEYDMVCKPGFDKDAISIKMDGISKVILNKDGSLALKTSVGDMSLPTPVAYQNINGQRVSVEVHYVVNGNIVTFKIGNFDASKTLLIDPIALRWATWLSTNSTGANHAHCVWVDDSDNIYTVARVEGTASATITTGSFDATANGDLNMIIGKYTQPVSVGGAGTRVWQTYVGGNNDNNPYAAQMGSDGNLYITGYTSSTDFPLTGGTAFSGEPASLNEGTQNGSLEHIFVMKINPGGSSIKGAVIGGDGDDESYDLRFTSTGDVLVCGETESANLATVFPGSGASGTGTKANNNYDVLVFRLSPDFNSLRWMKNYGGSSTNVATIMVDNPGNDAIYVAGYTSSTNFPTVKPRQSSIVGTESGFVQELDSSGATVWSSYFDAAANKTAQILCMEFNSLYDEIYFGGVTTGLYTTSPTSNISTGAYQTTVKGTSAFFIASMDTNQTFVAGTYVGGTNTSGNNAAINMMGLNTDQNSDVYILAYTTSTAFPTTTGAVQTTNMTSEKANATDTTEVFLKLYTTLDSLEYSTYYGGTFNDYDPVGERGIKFSDCRIYTLVTSESDNIPLTQGTLNPTITSSTSIYEPGLMVWSNPPDLLDNTISGSDTICNGSAPPGFTGSVPSYSIPIIVRNNVAISPAYNPGGSATSYQWQESTDSINWTNIAGGTTQNLASNLIGVLTSKTYFRRIISGDACIIAGAAEQTVIVDISSVGGTVNNVTCNGLSNGSITALPTGPSPYKYTWSTSPVQTTATASNLAPGTYTVTVVDGSTCSYSNSFIVTQPTVLAETIASQTNPTGCNGDNGSATANVATGGTKPYTYAWSPSGGNGITASNLSAGTYTVTATDSNKCTATATVILTSPASNLSASISSQTSSCFDESTGSATVSATGGKSPYTYSWNTVPVQTGATASGLAAGTYTVTVTDGNTCTTTATVIITQPSAALSASVSTSTQGNVSCFGGDNGSAIASVSGGAKPYSYSWNSSPVQTSDTAKNLPAGTYIVTITDVNNCSTTATAIIKQPSAPLSASVSTSTQGNVSCFGGDNGSAIASVSGGTKPYSYSWNSSPVQTSDTAKNLAAGTYVVTITDANNCSTTATAIITQPSAPLSASVSAGTKANVSCFGGDNGSAIASVSGGTKPYSYSWNSSPVQTSDTAKNLAAGTYVVTITDANNCSTTATAIITQPSAPLSASVSAGTKANVSCFGGDNGSAIASVSGGTKPYSYSWNSSPVQTSDTAKNLAAGTYVVTITDANNCSITATAIITQPSAPLSASVSTSALNNVSCFGGNNGSAIASVSGGTKPYSYSWNSSPVQTKDTAVNLPAGTYVVTITDANNCSTTATAVIAQPSAPLSASVSTSALNNVSCFGANNGSAIASVSGGTKPYSYSWNSNPIQTSDTATNLAAGTYIVTITDANNCSTTATTVIAQPSAPLSASVSTSTQGNVSCFGGNNGSAIASVSGGTQPYSYSWNSNPIQTSDTATNLAAGTYVVTITDANNCSTTATAIIAQPSAPLSASVSTSALNNVSCFGANNGSTIASVSGGTKPYSYSWNSIPVQTSDTAINLAAGTYVVTITDANNCSTTATAIITQPQAALSASVTSQNNASCFGSNNGSATVSVNGGTPMIAPGVINPYIYSWNTNPVQNGPTAINLSAGTYVVTVTDSNNCIATATAIITQPQAALSASITSQVNVSCFGGNGSATVTATGGTQVYLVGSTLGYKYSWNTNPIQNGSTATGLTAGTYTVTVTDSNGCTTTASAIITQPAGALNASVTTQIPVSCFGNSTGSAMISVNAGTPPYTYSWNTTPVQTSDTAINLAAGTYMVTVTDSGNCITTANAIIAQPQAALSASITSQIPASCFGSNNGSATVTASAGRPPYTYVWNTNPVQTGATASNLTAGTYAVTVTDSGSCTAMASIIISQPQAALSASISSQSPVLCYASNSGSAAITVSGGTQPYSYSWNTNPVKTADTANNLPAGTYTVIITDSNSCSTTASAIITQPKGALNVAVNVSSSTTICNGSPTTLSASVGGGTGNYTYQWSPGNASTDSITVNPSETTFYTVMVTDSNGCNSNATQAITVNPLPQVSITAGAPAICLGNTDTLNASGAVSYTWSPAIGLSATSGSSVAADSAKTYIVTGIASNGCSNTATVSVQVNPKPTVSLSGLNPNYCSNASAVTLIGVPPPAPPKTKGVYAGPGVSENTFVPSNGTVGGPYTISYTYTDSVGCSNSADMPVTILAAPNVIVGGNPNICLGYSDTLMATGGTSYTWSPVTGLSCASCSSTAANPIATTTYTVDVSNASCSASDSVVVHVFSVSVNAGPDQHILYGSTAQLAASGTGADVYVWSPGNTLNNDSISDPIASPTITTTYIVTGKDSLGCISIDSIIIYVSNPCESLMVPTGFTPDGSANRYFHVLNVGGAELQDFKVFNRWGQMVYETNDINDRGWDGTFNGKAQPMGTYVYYTELLCQGQTVFIKGNVTLLR